MEPLLKIESVTTGYESRAVLEDISLKVYADDFIGVIGPNGGGKTTLLRLIMGLLRPWKGSVTLLRENGRKINVGYMPQMSQADPHFPLTVTDVVMSGLMSGKGITGRMRRRDRARASSIMDEMGIAHLSSVSVGGLSGGQRQRVFLARALIGDPRLLLLDEPVSFTDNEFEKGFYEKLYEYRGRVAIIMVSHDLGTISGYVKSFACVNRTLHYHRSAKISEEQLRAYGCPIQLVAHGDVPHTVLKRHE